MAGVQSLVGELRSCKPCSTAKKKKKKLKGGKCKELSVKKEAAERGYLK